MHGLSALTLDEGYGGRGGGGGVVEGAATFRRVVAVRGLQTGETQHRDKQ